jgi:phospholipid transport system substrate-binding protein
MEKRPIASALHRLGEPNKSGRAAGNFQAFMLARGALFGVRLRAFSCRSLFRIRKGRSELMPFHSLLVTSPIPATAATSPVAATAKAAAPMSLLRRPLFLLVFVASLGLAAASGRAAPTADASAFVSDLLCKALQSLADKSLTDEQREKQFRTMLDQKFDMPRISRFVLGRYWTTASDQDKQNFQKLFEDYVVRAYSARFSQYSGEQVKVIGSRPESETVTLVTSQILRPNGAPPAKIDWRVRKQDNDLKIVDIDVEGVSMLVTQREEFGSVIQRSGGTVAALNKTLQERLASGDTSLAAPPLPQKQ